MSTNTVATAVHAGGRVALWVVLLLMALSVVYATAMVVLNWGAISV